MPFPVNRVTDFSFMIVMLLSLFSSSTLAADFHVYYLGGQSNMDGYGRVSELTGEQSKTNSDTMIFHGNTAEDGNAVDGRGVWAPLKPGHGVGFQSDGKKNTYSDRFGVELTFARQLQKLRPGERIALIKYSRGGTSIDQSAAGRFGCWEPDFAGGDGDGKGVNQYDHFLATLRNAMSARDIDGDGEEDRLLPAGIVWMQGESDAAYSVEIAEGYKANLKRLMDLIRAALRHDDLPVVIGRISDSGDSASGKVWKHGEVVRKGQAEFAAEDANAEIVNTTDEYGYSDPWHYDSAGYLDLGRRFANSLHELGSPTEDN